VLLVNISGNGLVPLIQSALPMGGGLLEAAGPRVEFAEMVLDGGVVGSLISGPTQAFFGLVIVAQPEIGPTQRIEISAVLWIKGQRLLDEVQRFFQVAIAVGQHVA